MSLPKTSLVPVVMAVIICGLILCQASYVTILNARDWILFPKKAGSEWRPVQADQWEPHQVSVEQIGRYRKQLITGTLYEAPAVLVVGIGDHITDGWILPTTAIKEGLDSYEYGITSLYHYSPHPVQGLMLRILGGMAISGLSLLVLYIFIRQYQSARAAQNKRLILPPSHPSH